jgi:hypothetical protein
MGVLDEYDPALLDERNYEGMDAGERAEAEEAMRQRDRREGRARPSRLAAALDDEDGAPPRRPRARRRALRRR